MGGGNDKIDLYVKTELYYRKIIELAKEKNIPLIVVISPYAGITEREQAIYNTAEEIAGEYGVPFINYNLFYLDAGIDYTKDAADLAHLNYKGNRKFTKKIGKYLMDQYNLTDRRGDKRYQSWQDGADYIRAMIADQELIETTDRVAFAKKVKSENYFYFVSVDGSCAIDHDGVHSILDELQIPYSDGKGIWYADKEKVIWSGDYGNVGQYFELNGHDVYLEKILSEDTGNYNNTLIIDHVEYKKVTNGINIIVYSPLTQRIVDFVGLNADDSWNLLR